jgi:secreted trypsin-like serine protease
MVGIYIATSQGQFLCGGFILNEHYIGTAAHCVDSVFTEPLSIRAIEDDLDLDQQPNLYNVSAHVLAIHPLYNPDFIERGYDIAILRTLTPIKIGGNIQPIALATTLPAEGDALFVAGYGTTEQDETGVLLWVQLPYVSQDTCAAEWGEEFGATVICAGGIPGQDSCQGDSGGALFSATDINNPSDAKVVGIVSFGDVCGSTLPGAYTSIPTFGNAWYQQQISVSSYCRGDCIKTFRKCVGPLRKCRRAKQACTAKCAL